MEQSPDPSEAARVLAELERDRKRETEPPRTLEFRFTGNASEYFRIWIVNTLLTVLTLGVYSAWAKIRNKQYFYGNTWVDGSNFEYLAKPLPILKGRLIAAAALGLLFGSEHYNRTLYFVLAALYTLATPWVVVKALAFNARNSAYRNLRFAFVGRTGEAFGVYLSILVVYLGTCGLAYPYAQWRLSGFVMKRHLYGDLPFTWVARSKDYIRAFLVFAGMILPVYLALIVVMVFAFKPGSGAPQGPSPWVMGALFVVLYPYLLVPTAYLRTRYSNLLYSGIRIGPHALSSSQRWGEVLKLYLTNLFGIVLSLGLLIPWAKIRMAKYRAEHLALIAVGSLHAETLFNDGASAVGEGLHDLGDFDLGIGT
jgi:uncharacterized membrane protein YjgN (DUF898 family)